jgi:hypothetical protein
MKTIFILILGLVLVSSALKAQSEYPAWMDTISTAQKWYPDSLKIAQFADEIKKYKLPTPLYLIFDKNTPNITKELNKYMGIYNQSFVSTCYVRKIGAYSYLFGYPILGGYPLRVKMKANTQPVIISPMSAVATQYPSAITISQLDQALQPLIEANYALPARVSIWDNRSYKYFANLEDNNQLFVIELEPENNRAVLVPVVITTTIH